MAAISDKLKFASSFDDLYVMNQAALDPLIAEFGLDLLQKTWEETSPQVQKQFLSNEKRLADHIHQLRNGCLRQLVEKVKRANTETLSSLHATPEIVIDRILSQYSPAELQNFAQERESLDQQLTVMRKKAHSFRQVGQENKILLDHFVRVYSSDVVKEALLSLSAQKRALLKSGCLALAEFKEEFLARCEGPPKSPFLSEKELLAYLKTARVDRFIEASNGVYVLEGMHEAEPLKLVVKIPKKPTQETFAGNLIASLQIKTPSQAAIYRSQPELHSALLDVLTRDKTFQQRKELPERFCVIDFIKGVTLEDASPQQFLATEENTLYNRVLFEMGEIAAADLLLYFQDRFPTIGIGNSANTMLEQDDQERFKGAVAIDQLAYLTSEPSFVNTLLKVDPFKRIKEIVNDLYFAPNKISPIARDLFALGLSEEQQRALDQPRALQALQDGLISGLSKIALLSEERLIALHKALPAPLHARDTVDLAAYLKMLRVIQDIVLR